jgi:hypothetical protein
MKAAPYAWVSQDKQRDNFSSPTQLEAMRQYASTNGLEVVTEYVEEEAQVVRDIFRWYVEDALSRYKIASKLSNGQIPTVCDGLTFDEKRNILRLLNIQGRVGDRRIYLSGCIPSWESEKFDCRTFEPDQLP